MKNFDDFNPRSYKKTYEYAYERKYNPNHTVAYHEAKAQSRSKRRKKRDKGFAALRKMGREVGALNTSFRQTVDKPLRS